MAKWVRFSTGDETRFGTVSDAQIDIYAGDMFSNPRATGQSVAIGDAKILTPVVPSKMVALANNSRVMLAKQGNPHPEEPHYFLKASTSFLSHGATIRRPRAYQGKIIFEAELGLVIGRECRNVGVSDALDHVFGCTCVNDVTAIETLFKEQLFAQWTRCKAADTFGPFGPTVETEVDPSNLTIAAVLNGTERQRYSTTDYVFTPAEIVSAVSHDMTLLPGDIIACGTSLGVGSMKPGSTIEISIDGIGTLSNHFE